MLPASRRAASLARHLRAARHVVSAARACSSGAGAGAGMEYETLLVERDGPVLHVQLNRPGKLNAMNRLFWSEVRECFEAIDSDDSCRAVVLSGRGKHFTAGLDMMDHAGVFALDGDPARTATRLRRFILRYQASFTAIERCSKPVIAAVHGACIGGGVDMITAADVRLCSADAYFCVKEVDIGLAADVGTLQRLPRVVGNDSLVRELALTARNLMADEALRCGLVSRVCGDHNEVVSAALDMARTIASKSPVAVEGTKHNLNFARDHPTASALEYMATWNMGMVQTEDISRAAEAFMTKKAATFADIGEE